MSERVSFENIFPHVESFRHHHERLITSAFFFCPSNSLSRVSALVRVISEPI